MLNMLRITFVKAFPYFLTRYHVNATCFCNYTACASIDLLNQSLTWVVLFNPACVTLLKHFVNRFFLDPLVSVDDNNSPQWRKLAWSQDCSMLACSYRFVMY